jgi:alpha-N-acetylglucosamine transferase
VQSSAPLVVFTLDVLHDAIVDAFHAVGAQVRQIPRTPVPPTVIILQPSWAIAWNKLYLLALEKDFDRIVFLDADTMLLQNVDELLQMEGWAAAPGQCKKCEISYGFNGGVFGFRPNITVYEELMQLASQKNPTNWHQSEQQLIGTYLARRSSSVIWISPAYNWMATGCDCLSKDQWSTIKILHWYCSGPNERPWEQYGNYWGFVRNNHCGY